MFDHFRQSDGSKPPLLCLFLFLHHWRRSSHWLLNWLLRNGLAPVLIFVFMFVSHCVSVCVRETACVRADRCLWICLSLCVCVGEVCVGSVVFYSVMVSRSTVELVFSVGVAAEKKASAGPRVMTLHVLGMPTHPSLRKHRQNKGAHRHAKNTRVFVFLCINVHACLRDSCMRRLCIAAVCSSPQTGL